MADETRTIRLVVRNDEATRALRQMNGGMQQLNRTTGALARTMRNFQGILGGFAVGFGVQQIFDMADAWTALTNRLKQFTSSAGETAEVMARITDIAAGTYSSIERTGIIFTRLSAVTKELGTTQEEVFQLTEAINRTFLLSGATMMEAESAARQLAQGLGSGALQGEELRAVLESNIVLAQIIADEFGVTIGQLKGLGAESQLLANRIIPAVVGSLDELQEKTKDFAPTVEQGFGVIKTRLTELIGEADKATRVFRMLGETLAFLGENLDVVANLLLVLTGIKLYQWAKRAAAPFGGFRGVIDSARLAFAKFVKELGTGSAEIGVKALAAQWASVGIIAKEALPWMREFFGAAETGAKKASEEVETLQNQINAIRLQGEGVGGIGVFGAEIGAATLEIQDLNDKLEEMEFHIADTQQLIEQGDPTGAWAQRLEVLTGRQNRLNAKLEDAQARVKKYKDALIGIGSVTETVKDKTDEMGDELERISKIFDDVNKMNDKRAESQAELIAGLQREVDTYGMSAEALRRYNAVQQIGGSVTDTAYQATLKEVEALLAKLEALEANTRAMERYAEAQQKALEESGTTWGAVKNALVEYANTAQDTFTMVQNAAGRAFKGIEDALVSFATTGKLEFKQLATSIIADIMRIIIRARILGPIAQMLGMPAGAPPTPGASMGAHMGGQMPGAMPVGFKSPMNFLGWNQQGGSYRLPGSGPRPVGMVAHGGERVTVTPRGEAAVNVVINNNAPVQVRQEQGANPGDLVLTIEEIVSSSITNNGRVGRAIDMSRGTAMKGIRR